jgi:DNA invertase Pin-like site-specific DNA recombinase
MLVGYARTSTLEQEAGLEAQLRELKQVGCKKLFQEQVSSVGPRPQLEAALDFCREGDTLVVTKLDRLARSVTHLGTLLEAVWERSRWGFSLTAAVIQAWNVDRAEPRPDGRDCQEDEALPV